MKFSEFIKMLLTAPEANSRFVFLVQGVIAALCVLIVTAGFIFMSPTDLYIDMIWALLSGGFMVAVGRNMTKRVGPQNQKENKEVKPEEQ